MEIGVVQESHRGEEMRTLTLLRRALRLGASGNWTHLEPLPALVDLLGAQVSELSVAAQNVRQSDLHLQRLQAILDVAPVVRVAMVHHILSEGLQDEKFCEEWVLGWERWRDFIFEKGYSPDWAAPLTGIPAEDIRTLADETARAEGCVIFASRGVNQHTNSVQSNRALMFLAAVTGNWGRRGAPTST